RIALGARSALFAPLENIGVVVVDEEHDSSYKQEEGFRYHARDAAIELTHQYDCLCVLGSATPSAESFYRYKAGGAAALHKLEARAVKGSLVSRIHIVDLKKSFPEESKIPHVEIK